MPKTVELTDEDRLYLTMALVQAIQYAEKLLEQQPSSVVLKSNIEHMRKVAEKV